MHEAGFQVKRGVPDTLEVSGALNFHTAARVLAVADPLLAGGDVRMLDLSGVREADSAGLACVLSLLSRSGRQGVRLQVRGMPGSLKRLAEVSDVEALLG